MAAVQCNLKNVHWENSPPICWWFAVYFPLSGTVLCGTCFVVEEIGMHNFTSGFGDIWVTFCGKFNSLRERPHQVLLVSRTAVKNGFMQLYAGWPPVAGRSQKGRNMFLFLLLVLSYSTLSDIAEDICSKMQPEKYPFPVRRRKCWWVTHPTPWLWFWPILEMAH